MMTFSKLKNDVRIITATSLFDGHDASINIMRRILQRGGAEVIHLGHNRSVRDIVNAAIQEDVQGICVSSYQGGHMEFFKYMLELLRENDASHIKIFGGGGGVIVHDEKVELEKLGITHIYHPDDGRRLGLEGMIAEILQECDFSVVKKLTEPKNSASNTTDEKNCRINSWQELARLITFCELTHSSRGDAETETETETETNSRVKIERPLWINNFLTKEGGPLIVGLTGPGGAGKSSLTDELLQRFLNTFKDFKVAVLSVDPTKKKTGGALLGERIRMNALSRDGVFMRSLATRGSGREISQSLKESIKLTQHAGFDLIFVETIGTGQGDVAVTEHVDVSVYVMTSEYGAPSQLEKIDMIDFADLIAVNKFDRRGSTDALRDVKKQYSRSRNLFDPKNKLKLPIYGTISSQFNDGGVNELFSHLTEILFSKGLNATATGEKTLTSHRHVILPVENQNYMAEIVKSLKSYKSETKALTEAASQAGVFKRAMGYLGDSPEMAGLEKKYSEICKTLDGEVLGRLEKWDLLTQSYQQDEFEYVVRDRNIKMPLKTNSLSNLSIPKISVPQLKD